MQSAASVSVLVVDDQAPFRRVARAVLDRARPFQLVGEAESGEEAEDLVNELSPALVLMDINLGGINGIEATQRIAVQHPAVMIVLLSTYEVDDLPPGARTCGARGYVNKEELSARLLRELWGQGGDPSFRAA